MKIVVYYGFTEKELDLMKDRVAKLGHELIHVTTDEEAIAHIDKAEVLMGHFSPVVTNAGKRLKWIQSFSAGMDKLLDKDITERDDLTITNMAGLYAPQGGEHAWALLLALARGVVPALQSQIRGEWKGGAAIEITGGVLGIIGLGGFGIETVKRAAGYDMTVLALDPVRTDSPEGVLEIRKPTKENLHSLLKRSDAVVVTCPRTEETYHMISRDEIACMKDTAYLVCTSRGGIIDENALLQALEKGSIAGAGLDVTEVEPLPANDPLWKAPNLLLTPHRAGASQHRPRKVYEFFNAQLDRYLNGQPVFNVVGKRRGF